MATSKHFAVHSGPEPMRHGFNVDPSPRDLEETYLPAFRATVTQGHVQSVMCAYNSIDEWPACTNKMLLKDHLRDAWGFKGFVVSDCGAIVDVNQGHKKTPDIITRPRFHLKPAPIFPAASGRLALTLWLTPFARGSSQKIWSHRPPSASIPRAFSLGSLTTSPTPLSIEFDNLRSPTCFETDREVSLKAAEEKHRSAQEHRRTAAEERRRDASR